MTLSCLNRPDEIGKVWEWAVEHGGSKTGEGVRMGEDEQLRVVRRVRGGLVKSAAVVGLPKVGVPPSFFAPNRRRINGPILKQTH